MSGRQGAHSTINLLYKVLKKAAQRNVKYKEVNCSESSLLNKSSCVVVAIGVTKCVRKLLTIWSCYRLWCSANRAISSSFTSALLGKKTFSWLPETLLPLRAWSGGSESCCCQCYIKPFFSSSQNKPVVVLRKFFFSRFSIKSDICE